MKKITHPLTVISATLFNTASARGKRLGASIDVAAPMFKTPVLMVHSDRAASGVKVPREIFEKFSSSDKTQVWLAGHSQLQFYEDPITIDLVKPHLKSFFAVAKS